MSKHSYIRDKKTGALINTDTAGFLQAKERKKLATRIISNEELHKKELDKMSDRVEQLEQLVLSLTGNYNDTGKEKN